ncbi:LptF/LptG family permease [Methylobrevis pamukkalensis]|uniref:Putative permease YjgP/YjgQ family protein n=1 Tax=Methylobrevis pamukkalensis TaxID=1439726 RepID=A0A1E3GZV8_9HYPH|nr:LptF/LptG family permease [Methylobrevis pamukkalensis]ODN69603.1 putative permease YjgP/YjgQ family protein [Methylobrevis pamukkalensis]
MDRGVGRPTSLQLLRDYTTSVRADILANIAQPGRFVEVDDNFLFHIRNRAPDGSIQGLFIHDSRDPALTFTYTAERGRFIEAVGKTLMVMERGTIERTRHPGDSTTFVAFDSYAFDLTSLQPVIDEVRYQTRELTLQQLLTLPADDPRRVSEATRSPRRSTPGSPPRSIRRRWCWPCSCSWAFRARPAKAAGCRSSPR